MKYIFEDKKDDLISILFARGYSDISDFIYANGNGNIIGIVNRLLGIGEDACVFLDTIPGNDSKYRIYKDLRLISMKNGYRVIVMPIVCAEYYFIKSIANKTKLFKTCTGVEECLNKRFYGESCLLHTAGKNYAAKCKNFEKYCKLILMTTVIDCVRHSRLNNSHYGEYYTNSCPCNRTYSRCENAPILHKSLDLLSQYPCVPSKSCAGSNNTRELSADEIWDVHRKLVREFNEMTVEFKEKDKSGNKDYREIRAIK